MRHVLVIGSTSFLGSRIALALHDIGYNVTLRDDLISLPLEPMAWYRYDKLVERNLIPRYEDFTPQTLVQSLLTEHNQGTVVYIPSLLFDGKHEDNYSYDYIKSSLLLTNFLNLLEIAKSCCSLKFIFFHITNIKYHPFRGHC